MPDLLRTVIEGIREFSRAVAGEVHELGGVTAAVVPACPERSVVNCVCYDHQEQLPPRLDELARVYDAAGIHAWTVWVPPADRDAAAALQRAGHVLDASPEAMGMTLNSFERPAFSYRWRREPDSRLVGPLNDRAYGYEGSFERAFAGMEPGAMRSYVAYVDGRPASCCATVDHGEDCHVTMVATLPGARGRGLAGALMAQALADASERGLVSSTLVATKMGRPVYARLGYRGLGSVDMWERRKA